MATSDKTDSKPKELSALNKDWDIPDLDPQLSTNTLHVFEISVDCLFCTLLTLPQEQSPSACLADNDVSGSECRFKEESGDGHSSLIKVARLLFEEVQLMASSERWLSGSIYKVLGVHGSLQKSIPMHIKDVEPLDRYVVGMVSSHLTTFVPF